MTQTAIVVTLKEDTKMEDNDIDINRENMGDAHTNSNMILVPGHTWQKMIETFKF